MKRIQSPSSINTYFQCPRKYFFIYNLKLPTSPSIHLVRGSVAHLALENFFDYKHVTKDDFPKVILQFLKKFWDEHQEEFKQCNLTDQQLQNYYLETQMMLLNWLNQFTKKLEALNLPFIEAFTQLRPETEVEYRSEYYSVRGFIDAIENYNNIVRLMDYKTSNKAKISDAYRLQLAIYALLYEEKHHKRPNHVGIYFLNEGEQLLEVNDDLIEHAKFMIEQIHASTETDIITDYIKKESPLCKWSNGQCDFYDYCYKGKPIPKEPLDREKTGRK